MSFRLLDTGWGDEFDTALRADHSTVRVVCPFIKRGAAELLLRPGVPDSIQVITRFDLGQMSEGVSDTEALRLLLESGAQIRGIQRLHTKMYLLGAGRVIVTSANLTEAALYRNHEFGFLSDDETIVGECRSCRRCGVTPVGRSPGRRFERRAGYGRARRISTPI